MFQPWFSAEVVVNLRPNIEEQFSFMAMGAFSTLFFNLRMDPYERAQITSNEYYAWTLHKAYLLYGAQAIAAAFADSLRDYPPRQKPQSFNLDQIMDRLNHPAESD